MNFAKDLPTTPEDTQALRDNRPEASEDWLNLLTGVAPVSWTSLPLRR
jgi:hypothetical protein